MDMYEAKNEGLEDESEQLLHYKREAIKRMNENRKQEGYQPTENTLDSDNPPDSPSGVIPRKSDGDYKKMKEALEDIRDAKGNIQKNYMRAIAKKVLEEIE